LFDVDTGYLRGVVLFTPIFVDIYLGIGYHDVYLGELEFLEYNCWVLIKHPPFFNTT